jgi:hypothetical protein
MSSSGGVEAGDAVSAELAAVLARLGRYDSRAGP